MASVPKINTDIVTMTRFLIQEQQKVGDATGDFTILLTAIQTACKFIANKVKKAGIANLYGQANQSNTSGDEVKKLDVLSNEVFVNALVNSNKVAIMVSEEDEKQIEVDLNKQGKYVVSFDPLDGSSNIDANVSIGSIFAIWKRQTEQGTPANEKDYLRDGNGIIASGYCLYGSSVHLLLAMKGHVNGFTLDPSIGEFIMTHPDIKFPTKPQKIYSINEGNTLVWNDTIKKYINKLKIPESGNIKDAYKARYIGSMVADIHRTLLYGGIFLYPEDNVSKNGKLRILYECFPMAYVVEQAGGACISQGKRLLDIQVTSIHQRCGIIAGSKNMVEE
ncbi:hypothetical protein PPERSA_08910 [Pseudocohnilembus persalinus]|uniref:fructose-bisphosphatase n=1 Tax=Pseudocohnilembus persalinus TaxID=266149 RepID=A0A0V0R2R9_PSEPJ|nr:hypothetical protein PPERSA_08910 [Pseudocohnilembus persalinus]|eukprot:KRX08806.1 hypothetical protein PPERSA_08910 [Pseudocohnilembus persalinus]